MGVVKKMDFLDHFFLKKEKAKERNKEWEKISLIFITQKKIKHKAKKKQTLSPP